MSAPDSWLMTSLLDPPVSSSSLYRKSHILALHIRQKFFAHILASFHFHSLLQSDDLALQMSGLCFTGGILGFARTRSVPSLVAGIGLGSLYAVSGMRIRVSLGEGKGFTVTERFRSLEGEEPEKSKPDVCEAGS